MEQLAEAKAGFRSLTEAIDSTTPAGRMMMQMVGSFARFERASCGSARRLLGDGPLSRRFGGRPPKLTSAQRAEIIRMISGKSKTAADGARLFGVHPATISRLLLQARERAFTSNTPDRRSNSKSDV
jgi:DNA invertase Pin-like site-specific DNA recombinase